MNFNPRSPHGERRRAVRHLAVAAAISIHAPRTGSDVQRFRQLRALLPISIHAPRTGSDHPCASAAAALPHFNPRSPHGERRRPPAAANLSGYFNPRSPHGERPYDLSYYVLHQEISIHAPRTGSDFRDGEVLSAEQLFQSTLPARGATAICWTSLWGWIFQSTLPARGATILRLRQHLRHRISIHAPRTGSDDTPPPSAPPASYFNPRSPHGERRFRPEPVAPTQDISIHAPRTGSDLPENAERITRRISIHAPRTGSDTLRAWMVQTL